eukprot:TRINITY_DN3920_c0_g1_i1.p1 TRINITY_DN3920_c0_g1~~TRINITY_DN3920_c0_g1_i1.p1  ORF type:complete len:248 (-),score=55.35 TRINITY_DN3920_c0_g1_i1:133-819(-)
MCIRDRYQRRVHGQANIPRTTKEETPEIRLLTKPTASAHALLVEKMKHKSTLYTKKSAVASGFITARKSGNTSQVKLSGTANIRQSRTPIDQKRRGEAGLSSPTGPEVLKRGANITSPNERERKKVSRPESKQAAAKLRQSKSTPKNEPFAYDSLEEGGEDEEEEEKFQPDTLLFSRGEASPEYQMIMELNELPISINNGTIGLIDGGGEEQQSSDIIDFLKASAGKL